ncbi:hypothetical protein JDV02_007130 [Purpureocillium takamizusanense]|uniref:Uncharacterized protein n=1 Tax=Purpureocillium takamizusanense TaxID=2060973 RepID=A0A9Q8QJW5_9HYPO|nr:uncharacterized protein JDV02_007130 [Purpureocillium takamizusanense]UNI21113.1 hypothetical protein JDV02_007130 [Purpureocillium takamizusanense]
MPIMAPRRRSLPPKAAASSTTLPSSSLKAPAAVTGLTTPSSSSYATAGGTSPAAGSSSKLYTNAANALAKMTVELGLRAVANQAERLERELKDVVAATARDDAFRREHERRLADMTREVLAVKARIDEAPRGGGSADVELLLERSRREAAEFREQLRKEMGDLRSMMNSVAAQLDSFPSPAEAEAMLASGVAGNHFMGPRASMAGKGFASVCRTDCSVQAPKRRIQEAISSTRRWHSDHKTSRLPDAEFVANYLKQQSKRDPGMAVFIQRAIQRRLQATRRRRLSSRPRSLDEFCRDVTWQDVEEAIVDALVHHEKSAIKALR